MKVLVTGANGFVGRHLVRILAEEHHNVVAVVRGETSDISVIPHNKYIKVTYCDMLNIEKLPQIVPDRDIDCCIHLAWTGATGVQRGDYNLQIFNIQNTIKFCESVSKMGIKRFVGVGTLAEKDVNYYISMDGSTPNKVAAYGVAKLCTHYMTKIKCQELGVEHIWCELSNVYGPGDRTNNFINFAAKTMLKGERAAFTAGEQMYDFVYITDAAKALYFAAKQGKNNCSYYVGSCGQKKLKEFILDIRNEVDPAIELHLGEILFHGICLPDEEFSCEKLCKDTGYSADVVFETGIKNTIAFLKEEL